MIVIVETDDNGTKVVIDDEIDGYCPTRTAELREHARRLWREVCADAREAQTADE